MRILFAFVGGSGHYDPLAPIARAARAAGHVLGFACRASMTAIVAADGFSAFATGPDVEDLREISPLLAPDRAREERVLREGFARRTARLRAGDILEWSDEFRPDIIVCDEVDFGAMIAAERLGLPHATVLVLAAGSFARRELLVEPLNEVRAGLGLALDPDLEMCHRHLVLAPFPPSFRDPAFPLPATAYAIRPAVLEPIAHAAPPSWLAGLGARRAVYCTLGTIFNMESGDLFPRVLAGVRELPVDVIATIGRQLDPAQLGVQPANVHIERFIPQSIVLPHCALAVSHGGSGSVIGALAHGLPSVLLPIGADQSHNAERCEQLGVARVLDAVHATPQEIRAAVDAALADAACRARAERIRDEIAALPGSATAVAKLEALL